MRSIRSGCVGADAVSDLDEARALVEALLEVGGVPASAVAGATRPEAGRRLLEYTTDDPDTAAAAREIVADPPQDDQMSVETAVVAAVVLGSLLAWLQTKLDIRVSRKDGRTDFEFRATKSATPAATVAHLPRIVAGFFDEQDPR